MSGPFPGIAVRHLRAAAVGRRGSLGPWDCLRRACADRVAKRGSQATAKNPPRGADLPAKSRGDKRHSRFRTDTVRSGRTVTRTDRTAAEQSLPSCNRG